MNTADEPLPELQDTVLDEETLDALFADLAELAEAIDVRVKHGLQQYAAAGPPDLAAARAALLSEHPRGVQLRYRFAGRFWCDTLLRVPGGVRLVRTELGG